MTRRGLRVAEVELNVMNLEEGATFFACNANIEVNRKG